MIADDTPLANVEFIAFDLETTGLSAVSDRIVEIGATRFRLDGTELGTFEQLVDPECKISAEVMRVHGISNSMVRGQPTISQVLPEFLAFLAGPDTLLLAHNASFDLGFLRSALARSGLRPTEHHIVDTLGLAQNCVRGSRSHKLRDLAIYFRIAETEDHRGLSDARLVAQLLRRIVARTSRLRTVGDLMRLSQPMRFADALVTQARPPLDVDGLVAAIKQQRTIVFVYDGGSKGNVQRRVTPREIIDSAGRSYLCAYCHADGIEKSFRLERIRDLRVEGD